MKDYNLMMGMLKDVEKMLSKDTSGEDHVRSAKSYVGAAMLLLAAAKRHEDGVEI